MRLPLLLLVVAFLAAGCDVRVGEQGIAVDIAEGRAPGRVGAQPRTGAFARRIAASTVNGGVRIRTRAAIRTD
jgi:hypothetical protein